MSSERKTNLEMSRSKVAASLEYFIGVGEGLSSAKEIFETATKGSNAAESAATLRNYEAAMERRENIIGALSRAAQAVDNYLYETCAEDPDRGYVDTSLLSDRNGSYSTTIEIDSTDEMVITSENGSVTGHLTTEDGEKLVVVGNMEVSEGARGTREAAHLAAAVGREAILRGADTLSAPVINEGVANAMVNYFGDAVTIEPDETNEDLLDRDDLTTKEKIKVGMSQGSLSSINLSINLKDPKVRDRFFRR